MFRDQTPLQNMIWYKLYTLTCQMCGKTFQRLGKQMYGKNKGKYCSRSCLGKAGNKRMREVYKPDHSGENNPNWKGGISYDHYHYAKLFRERYPEKYKAQTMLQRHVKAGKIIKEPCEICGDINVHAHHDNYLKPLEVRWLCPTHHRIEHGSSC